MFSLPSLTQLLNIRVNERARLLNFRLSSGQKIIYSLDFCHLVLCYIMIVTLLWQREFFVYYYSSFALLKQGKRGLTKRI